MKVSAGVGLNLVPVDILELEVLQGRGEARHFSPLPLPVLLIQRLVVPAPSLRPDGLCSGRSGEVTAWDFPLPFPSCAPLCLPPLCSFVLTSSLPLPRLFLGLSLTRLMLFISGLGRDVGTLSQISE